MVSIKESKNMRYGIDTEGIVKRKGETRTVNKKAGGTIDVCDAYLVDDSGEIKLTLWGSDIQKISDGSKVKITNGYTKTFKGEISLTKGKNGKLKNLDTKIEKSWFRGKKINNDPPVFTIPNCVVSNVNEHEYLLSLSLSDPLEHEKKVNDFKF